MIVVFVLGAWSMFHVLLWCLFLYPLRLLSRYWYQKFENLIWMHGEKISILLTNLSAGVKYTVSGDFEHLNYGRHLVISNHVASGDWFIQLHTAGRNNRGDVRFFLKLMHKWVPALGWICQLHDCIFLARDMKVDRPYMKTMLNLFSQHHFDNYLILYPEGTFTTPLNSEAITKSHKWSEETHTQKFYNVLCPRTAGFELIMETPEAFDYVTIETIAFAGPHYDVKLGETHPPTMIDFFRAKFDSPLHVHLHFKRYRIAQIPKGAAAQGKWLLDRFVEKEDLLNQFKANGNRFPSDNAAGPLLVRDNQWELWTNFILGWMAYLTIGYWWWKWAPYTLYGSIIFVFVCTIFVVGYDHFHQFSHSRPSKMETASSNNKIKEQ